jgi:hypothetical protein
MRVFPPKFSLIVCEQSRIGCAADRALADGFIFNMNTGQPASIAAGNMLYANGVADVVGPFSLRKGSVHWGDAGPSGTLTIRCRARPISISTAPARWDTSLTKGRSTENPEDSFFSASETRGVDLDTLLSGHAQK